ETVSGGCTNGSGNRDIWVPGANSTLGVVCYNSCSACTPPPLLISEIALPFDNNAVQFIELYNPGTSTIDFDSDVWYLCRQSNGGSNWVDVQLVGSIDANDTYTNGWNETAFNSLYSPLTLSQQSNIMYIAGGDDGLFLFYGGDHMTGILVDAYGVINEDGTGMEWEYNSTKAVRLRSVTNPNPTWTASEWDIPFSTPSDITTPGEHKSDVTWNGLTDNIWSVKGNNWSGTYGYIPDASFNVTVPASTPSTPVIYDNSSVCFDLIIESGTVLDVAEFGGGLTIYGDLTIDPAATLTIHSDAGGSGSLITMGNVTGEVVAQRYIDDEEWHLVSSPVSNATADVFYDSYLQYYDETVPEWVEVTSYLDPLNVMQGYAMWGVPPIRGTYEFAGAPNTGNQSIGFTAANEYGWNLIGNPYPSCIDWDLVTYPPEMNTAIYYLDAGSPGNYVSYNGGMGGGSQYVPPMQGFWVSANSPGTFTLTNDTRTHQGADIYYKNDEIISNYIELQVQSEGMVDKTYIRLNENASAEFDGQFDAYKLMAANTNYPQLFTIAGNDRLSINQLPAIDIIPMGFYVENSGNYTIRLNELNDIQNCQLEDLKTGTLQDLQQGSYNFSYTLGESSNRFLLHLSAASVAQSGAEKSIKIYSVGKEIFVKSVNPIEKGTLRITDLAGRTLAEEAISNENFIRLSTNLKSGIYLVSITESTGLRTEKVIIN
ncbi:MAG TPA: T9SS type A sorting domain-containing protein, partial [Bacteroidales bacterium]